MLELSAAHRWPQPLRVAALQACYNAIPASELPTIASCSAALAPSEQLLAAARLGPHRCIDPYRGSGTRLALPLRDACCGAFATRVWKLAEKLAAAAAEAGAPPPQKVRALAVNGRRVSAWPVGLSRLDALRHLDWHAFLDAHESLLQLTADPNSRAKTPAQLAPRSAPTAAGTEHTPLRPDAAAGMDAVATGGAVEQGRVAGVGVSRAAREGGMRVAGRAQAMASKARAAAALKAAETRIAAAVAEARRAAQQLVPPRNTVELELLSFTDEEVCLGTLCLRVGWSQ